MTTKPPTPTTEPKRASPVPSPETEALRALREVRKLDERIALAEANHANDQRLRKEARLHIVAGLSLAARKIFDLQMGAKVEPAKASEP
jgi:hypothetical protein